MKDSYVKGSHMKDSYVKGSHMKDSYVKGSHMKDSYVKGSHMKDSYVKGGCKEHRIRPHRWGAQVSQNKRHRVFTLKRRLSWDNGWQNDLILPSS
jgi:hypothetical protein